MVDAIDEAKGVIRMVVDEMGLTDEEMEKVQNMFLSHDNLAIHHLGVVFAIEQKTKVIFRALAVGVNMIHNIDRNADDMEYVETEDLFKGENPMENTNKMFVMFINEMVDYLRRNGFESTEGAME